MENAMNMKRRVGVRRVGILIAVMLVTACVSNAYAACDAILFHEDFN